MSARTTALDVQTFTLGGTNFLGDTKSWDFSVSIQDDDCRAAVDRYHISVPVKKKLEFTISRIPHVTGVCQSNLNISVYTLGGTSFLGEIESGTITVTTDVKDGSGAADIWEYPNVTGTDVEIQTNNFVTTNADIFQLAMANNITDIQVDVVITAGGTSVTLPMSMTAANHRIEEGAIQMQNVTLKLQGDPDSASGDAVFLEIITGDALVAWVCDTAAGEYSGNAIITQTAFSFGPTGLLKMDHTLANLGAPSFTPAA